MNRLGIMLLDILYSLDATSAVYAKSIKEILKDKDASVIFSYSTLYRNLKDLVFTGYLKNGPKDHKAETYYLSEKGLKYYREFSETIDS